MMTATDCSSIPFALLAGVVRRNLDSICFRQTDKGRVYRIKDGKAWADRTKQAVCGMQKKLRNGRCLDKNVSRTRDRAFARSRSQRASLTLEERYFKGRRLLI